MRFNARRGRAGRFRQRGEIFAYRGGTARRIRSVFGEREPTTISTYFRGNFGWRIELPSYHPSRSAVPRRSVTSSSFAYHLRFLATFSHCGKVDAETASRRRRASDILPSRSRSCFLAASLFLSPAILGWYCVPHRHPLFHPPSQRSCRGPLVPSVESRGLRDSHFDLFASFPSDGNSYAILRSRHLFARSLRLRKRKQNNRYTRNNSMYQLCYRSIRLYRLAECCDLDKLFRERKFRGIAVFLPHGNLDASNICDI